MTAFLRIASVFLFLAVVPARAEWVQEDKTQGRGFFSAFTGTVYYIDPTSIVKDGNFRSVWEIHDLSDKGSEGERSILAHVQYDCADKRMRTLKATGKSLKMANGQIIPLRYVYGEWNLLRPGNKDDEIYFKILNAVCVP